MTIRVPVSELFNLWHDAQRVDTDDMNTEQDRNLNSDAAIVNNHFGSGVLPDAPVQAVLFDSDNLNSEQAALLASNDFDGTGVDAHAQPSDTTLGEQLEVELTGSDAFGRLSVKVLIIGLDFNSTPQYDTFYFYRNEVQVTKKHYTRILSLFFYDFQGNNNCSRTLGGRVVVREARSFQLSRDAIMIAQDEQPNLFFRDFKPSGFSISGNPTVTLERTLQEGMGDQYSVDALSIQTNPVRTRVISASDVSTKIGEKFLASSNNIQKITLLLGAGRNDAAAIENRYDWSGDIVISVYALQTSVSCPTEYIPDLAIEYDPSAQPIAQITYSQDELFDIGYVLTDTLQPVDFIFSGTQLGSTTNPAITVNNYYCVTVSRSGAAGTGQVLVGIGNGVTDNARHTLFSTSWVDVPEEDMWFQVWSANGKVADGSAYDAGKGIQVEKTEVNNLGATVDYALDQQPFADTGEQTLNTGVVQAVTDQSVEEQDERTGNQVNSRQRYKPSFSFVTNSGLADLQEQAEPLIIGCAQDINPKSNDAITGTQDFPGLVKDDTFTIINPEADLLTQNLMGSKLIPNDDCQAKDYRIFRVTFCTDGYGDVNGDGVIDSDDVIRATALLGESLSSSTTQQKIVDGYVTTLELMRADVDGDGTVTSNDVSLISQFVARDINSFPVGASFTHLELQVQQSVGRYDGYFDCDGYIRLDGYTGTNLVPPSALDSWELVYDGYILTPDINGSDAVFDTVPYVPIPYRIRPQPFWQDYLLAFSSDARLMPVAFTSTTGGSQSLADPCAAASTQLCVDRNDVTQSCDPGTNTIMFPNDVIMRRGQILNPDGTHYKVDWEVGQIILNLPQVPFDESVINVFEKLVADNGDGFTSAGIPAMKFADCTTVQRTALANNQVRFGVAIQSFVPNIDGYDDLDGYGVIVDDIIGVYMDHATGILTLTIKDLSVDPVFLTLVTKIQITVYLKKGGFNNEVLTVDTTQIEGLLS